MEQQEISARKSELETGLRMHTSTTQLFRHWSRQFVYTDGVQYLAEEASGYWLLDVVASWNTQAMLRTKDFIVWTLTVRPDRTAVATAGDGNGRELVRQDIPWTDFPLDEVSLYLTDRPLLLPSEY